MLLTGLLPGFLLPPPLPHLPWLAELPYTTQDHKVRGGTTHSELGLPPSIVNQDNTPHIYLQVSLVEAFS